MWTLSTPLFWATVHFSHNGMGRSNYSNKSRYITQFAECLAKENVPKNIFLTDHKLYFKLPKITASDFLLHKFLHYFG